MYGVQHSNPTLIAFCPYHPAGLVNEHPQISEGSKKLFLTTMKKRTKKLPKEVNQSNSPSAAGRGLRSRVKSKLKTFVNKFPDKLSSKPPRPSGRSFCWVGTGMMVRWCFAAYVCNIMSCEISAANLNKEEFIFRNTLPRPCLVPRRSCQLGQITACTTWSCI
jgi:hypothetical protein